MRWAGFMLVVPIEELGGDAARALRRTIFDPDHIRANGGRSPFGRRHRTPTLPVLIGERWTRRLNRWMVAPMHAIVVALAASIPYDPPSFSGLCDSLKHCM